MAQGQAAQERLLCWRAVRAGSGGKDNQAEGGSSASSPLKWPPLFADALLSHMSTTTCDISDVILMSQDPRMMICEEFSKVTYF